MNRKLWATVAAAALCFAIAAPVAAADPSRPFGGWTSGTDTTDENATGCPAGSFIRYGNTGTGQFLHLGLVEAVVTHCTRLDVATGAGWFDDGTITITAANGDTLVLDHQGTFQLSPWETPPPWTSDVELTWVVVGGTGRFENATGSGIGAGFADGVGLPGSTTTIWLSGAIAY
jgi:hypothetical protein